MVRCHNQNNLQRKTFILVYGSRLIRVRHGRQGIASSSQSRKLRDSISNHTQEAERANWKWGEAMNFQSLSPLTYFRQQSCLSKLCYQLGIKCLKTRASGGHISFKWPHNLNCLLLLEAWNSPRVLVHSQSACTLKTCLKASIQPHFPRCHKNLYYRPIIFFYHIIGTHFGKLDNLVSIMTSARGLNKLDLGSLFTSFVCHPLHWNSTWFNDLSVLPLLCLLVLSIHQGPWPSTRGSSFPQSLLGFTVHICI